MNQDWSDEDNSEEEIELVQPNRDFPISEDEENEEEEYDMYELTQLTINKQTSNDLFNIKEEKPIETIIKKEIKIQNVVKKEIKYTKRKFNPRLPPPDKYKRKNDNKFVLNLNDFPIL
jgi:hypothetical protein